MYHHKNNIWMRKIEREDLSDLKELKNENWWGVHNTLIINDDDQLKWYNNISNKDLFMMVMHEDTKLGISSYTNIDYINRSCHVSGSGFKAATKASMAESSWYCCIDFAFEILNLRRTEAEVLAYNLPAQKRNIETIGMKVEGIRKEAVYKSGQYYDSIILGLLRSEWEEDKRVKSYGGSCNKNFDHQKAKKLIDRSKFLNDLSPTFKHR